MAGSPLSTLLPHLLWAMPALLGLVLLVQGLRRRPINNHPTCAACDFDLTGLAAPELCPECGRPLTPPGAIRIGVRARRWRRAATGLAFLLLTLPFPVVLITGRVAGTNWYRFMPTGLLVLSAHHRPGGGPDPDVLDELLARANARTLDPDLLAAVAREGLKASRTTSRWLPAWGNLILLAHSLNVLTDAEIGTFYLNGAQLTISTRRLLRQGAELPLHISPECQRFGEGMQAMAYTIDRSATLTGPDGSPIGSAAFQPAGGGLQLRYDDQSSALWYNERLSIDAPPGKYSLITTWRARIMPADAPYTQTDGAYGERTFTQSFDVEVVPRDSHRIRLSPNTSLTPAVRAAITQVPFSIDYYGADGSPCGSVVVNTTEPPENLAFEVSARQRSAPDAQPREWVLGRCVLAKGRNQGIGVGATLPPGFDADTVDLVLRPSLQALEETIDFDEAWTGDGPIVIENVKIEWRVPKQPAPAPSSPPSSTPPVDLP